MSRLAHFVIDVADLDQAGRLTQDTPERAEAPSSSAPPVPLPLSGSSTRLRDPVLDGARRAGHGEQLIEAVLSRLWSGARKMAR